MSEALNDLAAYIGEKLGDKIGLRRHRLWRIDRRG